MRKCGSRQEGTDGAKGPSRGSRSAPDCDPAWRRRSERPRVLCATVVEVLGLKTAYPGMSAAFCTLALCSQERQERKEVRLGAGNAVSLHVVATRKCRINCNGAMSPP